jgi:hypothetical protein
MRNSLVSSWVVFSTFLTLSACISHGVGFSELPFAAGWQRMPLGTWLLNDGVRVRTLVICPNDPCTHKAMVALVEADGAAARHIEAELASGSALSKRPAHRNIPLIGGGFAKRSGPLAKTTIERFTVGEMAATRIALTPLPATGYPANRAYAVVLSQRFGGTLKAVLAVTTDPDFALAQATAAAKDW